MKDYSYFFEKSNLLYLFVSAFDDAFVKRFDGKTREEKERVDVRYVFGPKHRVLHDLSDRAKTLTLPVVSIEETSLTRDTTRIHNKGQFIYRKELDSTKRLSKIPTPIPVNLELDLNIIAYYKEDIDQIVQNFVVNCNPYIIVSWKIPDEFDLPFYDEIRTEIQWSGTINYDNPKDLSPDVKWRISANTSFTVKGWLFKSHEQTQAPIYEIDATFISSPSRFNLCVDNFYDKLSAEGLEMETVSISAYPRFTNYFINGVQFYEGITIDSLNNKNLIFYGKMFDRNNTWYLSSGQTIPELTYTEIDTAVYPTISGYLISSTLVDVVDDNIVTISFPSNYFSSLSSEVAIVSRNDAGWASTLPLYINNT